MNQSLTLKLSEQTFMAIEKEAAEIGVDPSLLAATLIEQRFTQPANTQKKAVAAEAARAKFEGHFGSLPIDTALSANNEDIDADLAREYASNHE